MLFDNIDHFLFQQVGLVIILTQVYLTNVIVIVIAFSKFIFTIELVIVEY